MNEEIEALWNKVNLNEKVRKHMTAVHGKAMEIAEKLKRDRIEVNIDLVEKGSLLHDIGRSKEHTINHGLIGYKLLKEEGFSEEVSRIARNHVGAGIYKKEAVKLGLPAEDFIPETLEEKIVSYADNLAAGDKIRTFEETLKVWEEKFGPDSKQVELFKLEQAELEDYVTAEKMRELDKTAVEKGTPVSELMENAGRETAEQIETNFELIGRKIIVFAGSGNNGGDGFTAAQYLKKGGFDVQVVLFSAPKGSESIEKMNKASEAGVPISKIEKPELISELNGDIAIDALLGTGIDGKIREPLASVIKKINEFENIVSVDVPSGLNPDTGEEVNPTVKPDLIVTFQKFKKGLVGKYKLGIVKVVDIGIN
ncbi:MAG: NAD(P)H-hydrate epimerase [Candidatus Undinarchaeales archaeon]